MPVGSASGDEPCREYDIRLVGGQNMFQGKVEICSNGTWGTICASAKGSWSRTHAIIACRQLGLPTDCEWASILHTLKYHDVPYIYPCTFQLLLLWSMTTLENQWHLFIFSVTMQPRNPAGRVRMCACRLLKDARISARISALPLYLLVAASMLEELYAKVIILSKICVVVQCCWLTCC